MQWPHIDLFGGSGLLSHTIKSVKPSAKVVYNDFDNYSERLRNIDRTNALLSDLRCILSGLPMERRITGELRESVLNRLRQETGYIDFQTLSSVLLFTMHYTDSIDGFCREASYNSIPHGNYCADSYLEGVEIVRADYMQIIEQYWQSGALFIFDPPYLNTDNTKYKCVRYWQLKDYLNVIRAMRDIDYVYFTSAKSQVETLFLFIQEEFQAVSPFSGAQRRSRETGKNGKIDYTEFIFYKIRDERMHNLFGTFK
jgi:site-specific DNA-adenine methylase